MRTLALLIALLLVPFLSYADPAPINAAIGDASWHATFPDRQPAHASEVERIQTHLYFVADRLAAADVSHLGRAQAERRSALLDDLREYTSLATFPQRTYGDGYSSRRPLFIDERGVHCAVGELIRRSGHEQLARSIDEQWEYAYVPQMKSDSLLAWAEHHGFRPAELAMIQPAYSPPPSAEMVESTIQRSAKRMTLECGRKFRPSRVLRFRYVGDRSGNVRVELRGNESTRFDECVLEEVRKIRMNGGAWDSSPRAFRGSINLDVTPPQEQLNDRLGAVHLHSANTGCGPRPGVLAKTATVEVTSDRKRLRINVETSPKNAETEACLQERMESAFRDFGPGKWKLRAVATKDLGTTVNQERLSTNGPNYIDAAARTCWGKGGAKELKVNVVATRDADAFDVSVDGGTEAFAACVVANVTDQLRSAFSVSRKLPDGTYERYFRIDADVTWSEDVTVRTPEEHDARMEELQRELDERRYQ